MYFADPTDISFINGEYESTTTDANIDLTNINRNLPLAQLQQIQAQLRERLAWWFDSFRWERTYDPATANLIMHYNMATVLVGTRLDPYQTTFDQYTKQFQEIVRMADVYVKIMPDKTTFVFEDGIIGVLYFAATKCRVPSIRRKALELLRKAPRKECIWYLSSHVATFSILLQIGLPASQVRSVCYGKLLPNRCSRRAKSCIVNCCSRNSCALHP